ncbi:MAG: phosphomannomutase [Salibacteraceae bacterium]|jgi:phosphomannomutase
MPLIKSISGIRGTIGGKPNEGLTPLDVVKFTSAFGFWLLQKTQQAQPKIIVGRDARISGEMVSNLVCATLQGLGINVIDLGLSTTPTVEVAVPHYDAIGGIIITASHNPKEWNALKLLNGKGEFISANDGAEVLELADKEEVLFAEVDALGSIKKIDDFGDVHIQQILDLPLVNIQAIKDRKFKVVVDAVNSTGGIFVPQLLDALNVEVKKLYCEPNGKFPHNPEPLPENLTELISVMKEEKYDLGIVVDPDVDRLALVSETGEVYGEEYTLVAVSDYVLSKTKGDTVSNMSSTRALRDVTEKFGQTHYASAVGEVNVVDKMKAVNAVIGGEGNGGVIYPELHYGRDSLVGIALFLSHLAEQGGKASALRATYPNYHISKNKISLTPDINVDEILKLVEKKYRNQPMNTEDGLKIEFDKEWVHLRKSNTEPIIRIYSESEHQTTAEVLAEKLITDMKEIIRENR